MVDETGVAPVGRPSKYRAEFCEGIIEYFEAPLKRVNEVVKAENASGELVEVQTIIRPATLFGFAAKCGVGYQTLLEWEKIHTEFAEAMGQARALQGDLTVQMGASGGFKTAFAVFMMKNTHRWSDQLVVQTSGSLHITIDEQDTKS